MVTGAEHAGPNAQWIDLDVPVNFRDLGGNQTENGAVRRGLVYRSDSLVGLTDSDVRHLTVDLGIRTVLDLRSESETRNGRTELADQGTAYYHLPIGRRLGSIRRRGTMCPPTVCSAIHFTRRCRRLVTRGRCRTSATRFASRPDPMFQC